MDAARTAIARDCLAAAYDRRMDFPAIVATLIDAGFEGYSVDYRSGTSTYYLADGGHVTLANHPSPGPIALRFDPAGIAAQVGRAQAGGADYSYAAFCTNVKASGCAGYLVSFPGCRVVYVGRTAETHVEHFPA